MNKYSIFKLIVLLITWAKVFVLSLPIAFAIINLKQGTFQYGYDFFELNYKAAILISISLGLVFSIWNAFAFADLNIPDDRQFMKAKQSYRFKHNLSTEEMSLAVNRAVGEQRRWKLIDTSDSSHFFIDAKSRFGAKDKIEIHQNESGWILSSRPKWMIDIIDLGRNYKNIQSLSKSLISTT